MENKSKIETISRLLMIIGGAWTLIFGLLTAFIPSLAYVEMIHAYWGYEQGYEQLYLVYLPFKVQLHESSFGMLVSSVGGFLGLLSSVRGDVKRDFLGFVGGFLGVLGILFYGSPIRGSAPEILIFYEPWVGVCLTLIGVSIMFTGSVVKSEWWHSLSLLGIPLFLTIWLIPLHLIAVNNLPLLLSIEYSGSLMPLFRMHVVGLVLMLFGSVVGIWKSKAHLTRIFRGSW